MKLENIRKYAFFFLLVIGLIDCNTIYGQLNTNFEYPVEVNKENFSPNWDVFLTNADGMIDENSAYDGNFGFCVDPIDLYLPYAIDAGIHIPSHFFEKENLHFNLKINTSYTEIDSIVFKVAQSGYNLYHSEKVSHSITNLSDGWINYSVPFKKLNKNILTVKYIFRIYAKNGMVQIDKLELTIDDKIIETDKWPVNKDKGLIEKLHEIVMPLETFIKSPILKEQTTIIGLGENSHGIKECKKLRLDIISELSKSSNVNIIIEQPPIELSILNADLKQKSKEQLNKEINQLFFVYRSKEFSQIAQLAAKPPNNREIAFYGIDIQYDNYSIKDIEKNNIQLSLKEKVVIDRSISYFNNAKHRNELIYYRDSLMAVNALEHLQKDAKNIIFAHNEHLRNKNHCMGTTLNEVLKENYINIGVIVGKGYHRTNDFYLNKFIHPTPPILSQSYESIFHQLGENPFVLEMNKIKEDIDLYEQLCPRAMSTMGSVSKTSKLSHKIIDITTEYDYIIYYPSVEPMTLIGS